MRTLARAYDYAARRHTGQTRKGAAGEPYVNHVIDVAARVTESEALDRTLLLGALLHDIVEDTDGTRAEIAERFGEPVAALVMEVTDDKALAKAERKRLQVETAPGKSDHAKRIKLADKASNLAALAASPPAGWEPERKAEYLAWAERVVDGCRGVDPVLEAGFDRAAAEARRALGSPRHA